MDSELARERKSVAEEVARRAFASEVSRMADMVFDGELTIDELAQRVQAMHIEYVCVELGA